MARHLHNGTAGARRQRGAALYMALIFLILLALIGIASMRVSGLQERMAANYLRTNSAFQNAENNVRIIENAIKASNATYPDNCPQGEQAWLAGVGATTKSASCVRRIAASPEVGVVTSEQQVTYEITVLASDVDAGTTIDPSSTAVLQTTYLP